MIIHKEDPKRKNYYLCNHAVGPGKKQKLTTKWAKVTCKNCLKQNLYHFSVDENKKIGSKSIRLEDGTLVISMDQELIIAYPKKKFTEIFRKQMQDKKAKYLTVSWSETELGAIAKGLKMLGLKAKQMKKK